MVEAVPVNAAAVLWNIVGLNVAALTVYQMLVVLEHRLYRGWGDRSPFTHWRGKHAALVLPIVLLLYGAATVVSGMAIITGSSWLQQMTHIDTVIGMGGLLYTFTMLSGAARTVAR